MSNPMKTIRLRTTAFMKWANTEYTLGLIDANILPVPPPNWPLEKGATCEVESESDTVNHDYTSLFFDEERKFVVKIGIWWGDVDPSTQTDSIEAKIEAIALAIKQNTTLRNGVLYAGGYTTGDGQEIFDWIRYTGWAKKYSGNYVAGAEITMEWVIYQTYQTDTKTGA